MLIILLSGMHAARAYDLDLGLSLYSEGGYDSNIYLDTQNYALYNLPKPVASPFLSIRGEGFLNLDFSGLSLFMGYDPYFSYAFASEGGYFHAHGLSGAISYAVKGIRFGMGGEFNLNFAQNAADFDYWQGLPRLFVRFPLGVVGRADIAAGYERLGFFTRQTLAGDLQRNDGFFLETSMLFLPESITSPGFSLSGRHIESNEEYSSLTAVTGRLFAIVKPIKDFKITPVFGGEYSAYRVDRNDPSLFASLRAEYEFFYGISAFVYGYYSKNFSDVEWGNYQKLVVSAGLSFDFSYRKAFGEKSSNQTIFIERATEEGEFTVRLNFCCIEGADEVLLVGTMNDWGKGYEIRLKPEGDVGRYFAEITLSEGEYLYTLLVDGVPYLPEEVILRLPDGFGCENGVLIVGGGDES